MSSNPPQQRTKVVIAGAGPSGCLLAWRLLQRDSPYDIVLIERRPDPRAGDHDSTSKEDSRTFPIAIQTRGMEALPPQIQSTLSNQGVWTVSSCLHHNGKTVTIPRDKPHLTIDRNRLALSLLEAVTETSSSHDNQHTLTFQFETLVCNVDSDKNEIEVELSSKDGKIISTMSYDYLVACDGGRSRIRNALVDQGKLQCRQEEIPSDYRTIHILRESLPEPAQKAMPPTTSSSLLGSIWNYFFPPSISPTLLPPLRLDSDKIHGWMFPNNIKMIGCPIHPGTVSCAFVFEKGQDPFKGMTSPKQVQEYFQKLAPKDLGRLISETEAAALLARPTSTLISVRCNQLHVAENILLLGDAAHAVSPSVGQGANSALQDVQVFLQVLDECGNDNWEQALPAFTARRLADAHAVSDLSDYASPRTAWMQIEFVLRSILRRRLPNFLADRMRPMPGDLLTGTNWSYTKVLEATRWWVDRVKATHPKREEGTNHEHQEK